MCHALHASAGEEDWHRACVTLAQFDVLCPRTGTTVGGIAMCHNHYHPLLCRISVHTCVPVCVCDCFVRCYTVGPLWRCRAVGSFTVWVLLLCSGTDSFFPDLCVPFCIVLVWRLMFSSFKSSTYHQCSVCYLDLLYCVNRTHKTVLNKPHFNDRRRCRAFH